MKDISIKEKYEFYEDVFDNMPDALYVLDDKGNMIYVNYAMIKNLISQGMNCFGIMFLICTMTA